MQEQLGNMSDFKALQRAGLLGSLLAIEIDEDQFSLVGVNPKTQTAVVMYNTQLTERRIWSGSRHIINAAKKLGVDGLEFRIRKAVPKPVQAQSVTLSNGTVIS